MPGIICRVKVSLIFTVLNEQASLPALLDSIAAQTRQPDQVVVCDGGSRDGTLALLRDERRFAIRLISAPGANISRGRNLAIAAAAHPLIACTDAGTRLHPEWLARLAAPFEHAPAAGAVAGFFEPDAARPFEIAMSATVLPARADIKARSFLPSSRSVAYRKSAWEAAGGYPEWLDYCEDLVFDFAVIAQTGGFEFVPDAIAYFRPRGTLRAFFKQYYLYARGDGKAGLWRNRHLLRYGMYLIGLPVLLAGFALLSAPWSWLSALALLLGAAGYLRTPYRRLGGLWSGLPLTGRAQACALVPLIRLTGDLAKMAGYPVGLRWRASRRPDV